MVHLNIVNMTVLPAGLLTLLMLKAPPLLCGPEQLNSIQKH